MSREKTRDDGELCWALIVRHGAVSQYLGIRELQGAFIGMMKDDSQMQARHYSVHYQFNATYSGAKMTRALKLVHQAYQNSNNSGCKSCTSLAASLLSLDPAALKLH